MRKTLFVIFAVLLFALPALAQKGGFGGPSGPGRNPNFDSVTVSGNTDSTGTLTGLIPVVTVNGSDVTLTAQQCRGAFVRVITSNKVIIPASLAAGSNFQVYVFGAVTAKIVPPSGGQFDLNGAAQTANYILTSPGTTGQSVSVTFDGTYYHIDPSPGCTWTAGAS